MCIHTFKNKIILSNKASFIRNIDNNKFLKKLSKIEARELSNKLIKDINSNFKVANRFDLWTKDINLEGLKENNIINFSCLKNKDISSILYFEDENFNIIFNEEEHLRLQYAKGGHNIKESFDILNEIDDKISGFINYNFNEKFGYLMSKLENTGSGLKLEAFLHLPILTLKNKIIELLSNKERVYFDILGKYGERGKSYGSIYKLKSINFNNISDKDFIYEFDNLLNKIVIKEKESREELLIKYKLEMEDKVFRSLGILKNARLLDSIESLNLLSDIRFGVEEKFLNFDISKIDKAMLYSRNSFIRESLAWEFNVDIINKHRASIIRNILN